MRPTGPIPLRRVLEPPPSGEEERSRVRRNLRLSLRAALVGASLGAVSNGIAGRPAASVVLAAFCALCLLAAWLLRRGRTSVVSLLTVGGMIAAIFSLQVVGRGVHDHAALLYPVVILVAALLLDVRLLVAATALCTGAVIVLVRLETAGVLPAPYSGRVGWLAVADTAVILLVTGVAARLLVADVVGDIAEARARGARLAEANRQLEARTAELERFTYVVSHDLKSPLVTIRGFLGYVAADAREGDLTRLEADVGRIHAATERMGRLLDDLLELSRTGRIARAHEDVPLLEVVREARGLVEGRLGARGVRVEVEGPLPSVHGDAQQLVDLLQNLLDNAAKFMGAQAEPRVWIGSRGREDALLVLFVRDNGIGIAPAHQAQVFEPFCRLDPRAEGTGLGLALARRIVETHGGRLWVESEGSGRGSTFCFTLPEAAGSGGA